MLYEGSKAQNNSKDQPVQLNNLCRTLSCYLENRDYLGVLIGYCVYEGLRNFNTISGSKEEVKFEEIKAIYNQLEQAIKASANDQAYQYSCQLNKSITPLIEEIRSGIPAKTYEPNSKLLEEIADALRRKHGNFEDIVRRQGSALFKEVSSKGPFKRLYDSLTEDYNSIRDCFAKAR